MIGFVRFHHPAGDPFGIVPLDELLNGKGAMFPRAVINPKNLEPRTGFVRVGEDDGGHGGWLSRRRHSYYLYYDAPTPVRHPSIFLAKAARPSRPQNSIGGSVVIWPRSLVDWPGWQDQGAVPSVFAGIAETELTLWRVGTYCLPFGCSRPVAGVKSGLPRLCSPLAPESQ